MTPFQTDLILAPLPNRQWRVVNDFIVKTSAGTFTVPADFICDLNSIPRLLWWRSTPTDFPEAGAVHDYLYRTHKVDRATADKVYLELLLAQGMGRIRAHARYRALRMFGQQAYTNGPKRNL